uniref:Uncharacterized protein n=1 Tax=Arion vulgaris TaxID=1028688 RepID=A0A0B7AQP2_9EUPU
MQWILSHCSMPVIKRIDTSVVGEGRPLWREHWYKGKKAGLHAKIHKAAPYQVP